MDLENIHVAGKNYWRDGILSFCIRKLQDSKTAFISLRIMFTDLTICRDTYDTAWLPPVTNQLGEVGNFYWPIHVTESSVYIWYGRNVNQRGTFKFLIGFHVKFIFYYRDRYFQLVMVYVMTLIYQLPLNWYL